LTTMAENKAARIVRGAVRMDSTTTTTAAAGRGVHHDIIFIGPFARQLSTTVGIGTTLLLIWIVVVVVAAAAGHLVPLQLSIVNDGHDVGIGIVFRRLPGIHPRSGGIVAKIAIGLFLLSLLPVQLTLRNGVLIAQELLLFELGRRGLFQRVGSHGSGTGLLGWCNYCFCWRYNGCRRRWTIGLVVVVGSTKGSIQDGHKRGWKLRFWLLLLL